MDTKLLETLQQYWLSDNESKIYITILEYGQAVVSMISRKTWIKRTTLYGILEYLKRQGIVQEIIKNDIKYFFVISPDTLFKNLEKKYLSFKESLPELMTVIWKFGNRPRITFYEGKEQIENMLYEHYPLWAISMANYDHTWRWYQDHHFVELYIDWLNRSRQQKSRKEKIKLFTNKSDIEKNLRTRQKKVSNRTMKFLPKWFEFKSTLWVCWDYIVMFVFKDEKQYAYEIQDAMLWSNIREIFKMLRAFVK